MLVEIKLDTVKRTFLIFDGVNRYKCKMAEPLNPMWSISKAVKDFLFEVYQKDIRTCEYLSNKGFKENTFIYIFRDMEAY